MPKKKSPERIKLPGTPCWTKRHSDGSMFFWSCHRTCRNARRTFCLTGGQSIVHVHIVATSELRVMVERLAELEVRDE